MFRNMTQHPYLSSNAKMYNILQEWNIELGPGGTKCP